MSSSFQSTSEVIPPRDLFRDMITPTRGWTPTGLKKTLEPPSVLPHTGVESNSEPVYYDLDTGYRYYPLRGVNPKSSEHS